MTAPTSPCPASRIATAIHFRLSSILSCGLPCLRRPTPSTPANGLAGVCFCFTHQAMNVFASASTFRCVSTEGGFLVRGHGAGGKLQQLLDVFVSARHASTVAGEPCSKCVVCRRRIRSIAVERRAQRRRQPMEMTDLV